MHLIAYCRVDSIKCTSTAALVSMFKFNLAPKNSCRVGFFFVAFFSLSLSHPKHDRTLVSRVVVAYIVASIVVAFLSLSCAIEEEVAVLFNLFFSLSL